MPESLSQLEQTLIENIWRGKLFWKIKGLTLSGTANVHPPLWGTCCWRSATPRGQGKDITRENGMGRERGVILPKWSAFYPCLWKRVPRWIAAEQGKQELAEHSAGCGSDRRLPGTERTDCTTQKSLSAGVQSNCCGKTTRGWVVARGYCRAPVAPHLGSIPARARAALGGGAELCQPSLAAGSCCSQVLQWRRSWKRLFWGSGWMVCCF